MLVADLYSSLKSESTSKHKKATIWKDVPTILKGHITITYFLDLFVSGNAFLNIF